MAATNSHKLLNLENLEKVFKLFDKVMNKTWITIF